jgi:hypothetical protein
VTLGEHFVDTTAVRAVELDAVLRSIDDRLDVAGEDERALLLRARQALEHELAALLTPLTA